MGRLIILVLILRGCEATPRSQCGKCKSVTIGHTLTVACDCQAEPGESRNADRARDGFERRVQQ